jgi:hypothetical protein
MADAKQFLAESIMGCRRVPVIFPNKANLRQPLCGSEVGSQRCGEVKVDLTFWKLCTTAQTSRADQAASGAPINLPATLPEPLRFLPEPLHDCRRLLGNAVLRGVVAHVLRDLHRAEVRPAHRAEVSDLRALCGQGHVVELACRLGIEREVELVLPAELEPRARERVVPVPTPLLPRIRSR